MVRRSVPSLLIGAVASTLLLSACSSGGGTAATPFPTTPPTLTSSKVVLLTHDSFAVSKDVLAEFTRRTGVKVTLVQGGDAGQVVNRVVLAKGRPEADVVFGIDNALLGRAAQADVLAPFRAQGLETVDPALVPSNGLATPIDRGDVCLNVDREYFASRGIPAPESFDDLLEPRYRGLTVVQNPSTSSPGLAFLLATIESKGEDGWQDYWRSLKANDVRVVDGWETAYYSEFSGGSGKGTRPIVVSYASSPVAEVVFADPRPSTAPTAAVLGTCFEQVEYAAVLAGAKHPDAAGALIDFMLAKRFQEDIPLQMFVYPVNRDAKLPPEFARFAPAPAEPLSMPTEVIDAGRETWLREWRAVMDG